MHQVWELLVSYYLGVLNTSIDFKTQVQARAKEKNVVLKVVVPENFNTSKREKYVPKLTPNTPFQWENANLATVSGLFYCYKGS